MNLSVIDKNGSPSGELVVGFPIIENAKGTQSVHDFVVAHRAAQRSGTACTKTAGEVAGTNKKPWRQKGTGRARAGSFQSPLWRGGGVVFGPRPRDFSKKVNRKVRGLALHKALSARLTSGDVLIVDEIKLESAKTKEVVKLLKGLKLDGTTLLVIGGENKDLCLAARNVASVEIVTGTDVNAYQVLRSDKLVFTKQAFEAITQRIK